MSLFQGLFLGAVAALLIGAWLRWRATPRTNADYAARGDMTRLLAVILVAQALNLVRTRFAFGSAGFTLCTVLLLPLAVVALALVWRLLQAYRHAKQ